MAPVALELAPVVGVLEPMQAAASVEGQVSELRSVLEHQAEGPVTLIGHSWGAWLSWLLAARHPALVGKLVLVGSAPFTEEYASTVLDTRLARLGEADARAAWDALERLGQGDDALAIQKIGRWFHKADTFEPLDLNSGALSFQPDIFRTVWDQAQVLRRTGRLLELGTQIRCPVVAIHGDYDPHPADGVRRPLSTVLTDFRFLLLDRCGHTPWKERYAREEFFGMLRAELE
jgi:pimeloyl-ACP methyl ester carboxylesterase